MKRSVFLSALCLGLALLLHTAPAGATDGDWAGCFVCHPHDFGTDPDYKCYQVGNGQSGTGTQCSQRYLMGGHTCWTEGGACFNVNSGGDEGCWAEDCWSWNDGPGGGRGGGGGNECHVQSGSYCPASCMSCTYFYY